MIQTSSQAAYPLRAFLLSVFHCRNRLYSGLREDGAPNFLLLCPLSECRSDAEAVSPSCWRVYVLRAYHSLQPPRLSVSKVNLSILWLNGNNITRLDGLHHNLRLKELYLHRNKCETSSIQSVHMLRAPNSALCMQFGALSSLDSCAL